MSDQAGTAAEAWEAALEEQPSYTELLAENESLRKKLAEARAELTVYHRWCGSNPDDSQANASLAVA